MNKIPLTPQWGANGGCVSTPEGGLLYVGSKNITFIQPLKDGQPNIQIFYTRQPVRSIDINPNWAAEPLTPSDVSHKLFVALFQDNSIQLFDINKDSAIQGHKAHLPAMRCMEGGSRPSSQNGSGDVYVSFMCNSNILSIDNQDIVIYCIVSNLYYRRPMFISARVHQITALKCSPYNENHFAVGTRKGLVLLCDLAQMVTLYTLRSHDTSITSLAWNRLDLGIDFKHAEPKELIETAKSNAAKENKLTKLTRHATIDPDEIFDIYDYDYLDNEFGAPVEKNKSKSDLISDFVGIEKPSDSMATTTTKFDFAEACQSLKEEINALRLEQPEVSQDYAVTLEECQDSASQQQNEQLSSSCGASQDGIDNVGEDPTENEPTSENISEAFLLRTVSSDDSVDIDGMDRTIYMPNEASRIVCQAEVHADSAEEEKLKALATKSKNEFVSSKVEQENSPDSKENSFDILLASTSLDGSFCIWNAKTGASCDSHKVRGHHQSDRCK